MLETILYKVLVPFAVGGMMCLGGVIIITAVMFLYKLITAKVILAAFCLFLVWLAGMVGLAALEEGKD